jgi:hypothetical protein
MATRRRRSARQDEHTHSAAKVRRYDADSGVSFNWNLHSRYCDFSLDEPVEVGCTSIKLYGTFTYPATRAGQSLEVEIRGSESRFSRRVLKDVQKRDSHGAPTYRTYRGAAVPVFEPYRGLGLFNHRRAEGVSTLWLRVEPRLVSDWLTILSGSRELYVSLHEVRSGRDRWVQSISLQTTDPEDE